MKTNRHGRAKVLSQSEIQLIFKDGLPNDRDKTLFGVCLFTAAKIRECCTLLTADIYTTAGKIRPPLIIRKSNTKGKLSTRSIPVIEDLRKLLADYYPLAGSEYLFPGCSDGHISEDSAARIFNTFAIFLKRPQAISLGLQPQSPPAWARKNPQSPCLAGFVCLATPF